MRGLVLSFLQGDDSHREAIHWRVASPPEPGIRRRSTVGIVVLILASIIGAAAAAPLGSLAR